MGAFKELVAQRVAEIANLLPSMCLLKVRALILQDQRPGRVKGGFYADMLHTFIPCGAQVIKTKGVLGSIDFFFQTLLHFDILRGIYLAFKHGKLHALSVIQAHPGDTPKAFGSSITGGGNIIRN
jgi:hypothetical protein